MNKSELKNLINEVMQDIAKESLKNKLKKLISEEIEEIKYEKKETVAEQMEELEKVVKETHKDGIVELGDDKNYWVKECFPHAFHIRPQSQDIYDVQYFKDKTDRTKKLGLKFDELKEFVKETLKSKELNYVKKAYNKVADSTKDKVEKAAQGLPQDNKPIKKELKDTKNDNKDYIEQQVKDEKDMPEKPMREVEKFKKQSEHPIKGTKPDYTYPKQKDKKLVAKLKTYKGKGRKKD
jgi:hypothetical protein